MGSSVFHSHSGPLTTGPMRQVRGTRFCLYVGLIPPPLSVTILPLFALTRSSRGPDRRTTVLLFPNDHSDLRPELGAVRGDRGRSSLLGSRKSASRRRSDGLPTSVLLICYPFTHGILLGSNPYSVNSDGWLVYRQTLTSSV